MNNFTYEKTRDATHFHAGSKRWNPHFSMDGGSMLTRGAKGWAKGVVTGERILIELFRPHNETREYWTTKGVTQYAQPQGNEMNTDKLISIDFSRNITPFVAGDVYWNNFLELELTMGGQEANAFNNASPDSEFDTYFIVSFADRPNTGTQPVGDDVRVFINDEESSYLANSAAITWDYLDCNKTWKPNHAAMLKQWQAEQLNQEQTKSEVESERPQELNEEYLKGCGRDHLLMFSIDMLAQTKYQQGVIDELTSAKYQAEQSKGATWNVKESHVPHGGVPSDLEAPDPSVDENSDGSKIGNIGNILHNMSCSMTNENEQNEFGGYASFCWELGVKLKQNTIGTVETPVFTEEFLIGGGKNVLQIYKPGKLLFKGSKYSIFVVEGGKEYSRRNAKIKSRPIQTTEDKCFEDLNNVPRIFVEDVKNLIEDIKADKIRGVKWVGSE